MSPYPQPFDFIFDLPHPSLREQDRQMWLEIHDYITDQQSKEELEKDLIKRMGEDIARRLHRDFSVNPLSFLAYKFTAYCEWIETQDEKGTKLTLQCQVWGFDSSVT